MGRYSGSVGAAEIWEKVFFFEKKNQKTLTHGVRRRGVRDSQANVFCFFSSEKKTLGY
jgi:hypothetical protein